MATFAALAMLSFGGIDTAAAQSKIKVIVNDQPITTFEIAQRSRLLRLTGQRGNLKKLAINELIDDKLKLQEASKRRVQISDTEVNQAFANIASRTKMTAARLAGALRQSGVNPRTLKERLRSQIAWSRVVRQRFNSSVKINEQAIQAALTKDGTDKELVATEYTYMQIIIVAPASSSKGRVAQRRREANNLRARFNGCDSGVQLAKNMREVIVKKGGTRNITGFPQGLRKDIQATGVGKLTKPIRVKDSIDMLAICAKEDVKSDAEARAGIQDKLMNQEGEVVARRYLRDIRRDAIIQYR